MVVLALSLAVITGCATTRVHLYTEGMESKTLGDIRDLLEPEGYAVELNTRPVPPQLAMRSLVYSPYHRQPLQVERLHALLSKAGYDTALIVASVGNHHYTRQNVGLYLVPYAELENPAAAQRQNADRPDTLAGKSFNGDCPAIDAVLELRKDDSFTLQLLGWDDRRNRERVDSLSGTWRQERLLMLETQEASYELQVERFNDEMQFQRRGEAVMVRFAGIRLKNDGDALQGCSFSWRQPVAL